MHSDFARNTDSLANQERLLNLQREEMLAKLGDAIIPAITRATSKLNQALDEMDGDLSDIAGDLADILADGFVWLIDNADTVIAGLKGITAAMITKKSVDGVMYAVEAYKTLTTVTHAATAAQTAYNTASKASVIGAVASLVIGLGTAMYSYVQSTQKAVDITKDFNDELLRLVIYLKQKES